MDRCEPEQVLNLISAIKLFFTLGQKTIFFCGIDKEAVEAAVKTKYNDVIKANEYLEKIFDFSFSMPEVNDIRKLINNYFDGTEYSISEIVDGSERIKTCGINDWVYDFFIELEFTNPRRLKKVLNKFMFMRTLIQIDKSEKYSFPNIDLKNGICNNLFETLLVLYLITLNEFYPEDFNTFLNFELKKEYYTTGENTTRNSFLSIVIDNNSNVYFSSIFNFNKNLNSIDLSRFFICISPLNVKTIHADSLINKDSIRLITLTERKIDYLFFKYIITKDIHLSLNKNASTVTFRSLKKLITDFL